MFYETKGNDSEVNYIDKWFLHVVNKSSKALFR